MREAGEKVVQLLIYLIIAIACCSFGVIVGQKMMRDKIIKAESGYYLPVSPYGWQQTRIFGDIYYRQGTIIARVDK